MKQFLLLSSLIILAACNSGKKDDPTTIITKDTTLITDKEENEEEKKEEGIFPDPEPDNGKVDIESFGKLKLEQAHGETIKILGEPTSKSKAIEWAADGLMHEDWTWAGKGLVLGMSYDKSNPAATTTIFSITATAPCNFKTRAGLGIGSTYAEVQAAYKKDIDPEATDKTQITVGSVYGGIIFSFTNDKASKIFLGAEAE